MNMPRSRTARRGQGLPPSADGIGLALIGLALGCATLSVGCGRGGDPRDSAAAPRSVVVAAAARSSDSPPLPRHDAGQVLATPVAFAETSDESSGPKGITFDDIKFDMKKGDKFKQRMLTEKVKGLFDQNIRIRGYIQPTFKQNGLNHFILVRDNMECCFGPGAALYDCIIVDMAEGHTASFSVRPVTVEGKFSFQKLEDPSDGALRAIYHLDGVNVK
jgi:hypothetical protein